ncbi:hypothetical protein NPX13_g6578 [Xylaria arbuscula]|uniref:Uncharacterized protein n=1 Tax=Xylaria arbuscula TaxID=114810 RepID=A0A9W8NBK8_9PEZI|nr:hypothetical protein NPX13_g6578 [Xylaria arbuscula]
MSLRLHAPRRFSTDFKHLGGYDVLGPVNTTGDCFLPNYTNDENKYYSPGISPAGYTAACVVPAPGLCGGQTSVTTAKCCSDVSESFA